DRTTRRTRASAPHRALMLPHPFDPGECAPVPQSCRSATVGSTSVARRAGTQLEIAATTSSSAGTPRNTLGLIGRPFSTNVEKAYGIRRRTDLTAARPTRLSDGFHGR